MLRGHALGQHHGHHGQGHVAHLAAVHGIGVPEALPAAAVVVPVALGPVGLLVVGQAVPPVAVLHVYVHLPAVGLAFHIVLGGRPRHAVGADGGPGAHDRLAHAGARARLGVVGRRALHPGGLVGLVPLHGRRVHHALAGGHLVHGHGVVLHRAAAHGGHVRRAVGTVELGAHVPFAHPVPRAGVPYVVHAKGLAVVQVAVAVGLVGVGLPGGAALEVVEVEQLVVGARLGGHALGGRVLVGRHVAGVHRAGEHAVVPGARVVGAEDVRGDVHVDLVAGVAAVAVGVGGVGGLVVDVAAEPLAQRLAHGDAQHPGLGALHIGCAAGAGVGGGHRLVGGERRVGGQVGGAQGEAVAVVGRVLRVGRRVVARVVAPGRLHHFHVH